MNEGTLTSYITGFIASIVLTLAAYFAVTENFFTGWVLPAFILLLAIAQLSVQAFFFLHIGKGPKQRPQLIAFFSTLSFVVLIILGSIWIMKHLNYNMSADELTRYIESQQGGF